MTSTSPRKAALRSGAVVLVLGAALYLPLARQAATQTGGALTTDGKILPVSVLVNGQNMNNGYPDLVRDRQGNLWCVWVSARQRDPLAAQNWAKYEEGDMIVLRARKNGAWGEAVTLNTNFGVNFAPALAEDGDGNIQVVWSSRRQGEDGIYWRRVTQDMKLGNEIRVPPAGRLEAHPALAAGADGRVWLAMQSWRSVSSDIVFFALENEGWRRMADVAATPDPEYRPRLAAAPDGSIWCAWDAFAAGKYRVMIRRYDPRTGAWDSAEAVPGDGLLDIYAPDIAAAPDGRIWVVYARNEIEEQAWGLRGPKAAPSPRPTVRIAVRDRAGWALPNAVPGQAPGFVHVGDLPRVEVDQSGAVWPVWQTLPGHVDWKVGAGVYHGDRWGPLQLFGTEEPVAIDGPMRRADQRPAIVNDRPGHLILAYERGRGAFRNRDVFLREVKLDGAPTGEQKVSLTPVDAARARIPERPLRPAPKREPVLTNTGERLHLYFGDLHNHLLVDDGHQGTVDQLFAIHRHRYSSDFAATTSHGDSNKLLISELADNDLMTESLYQPGRFVTIPGFEWTQGDFVVPRAGHRHVIYETPGGPLYRPTEGHSDSIREFVDLMSKTNGLIFAHHITRGFTAGTDWTAVNVKIEPAVEMCSSWGRFEYYQNPGHIRGPEIKNCSVQDAWRMGWRLGVIGGSDGHNLFADRIQGLTGIYATELTRPALFAAIRTRRVYATTGEPIALDFRVNSHLMGSQIASPDGPVVEAAVTGTAKLISFELVKYSSATKAYRVVLKAPVDGTKSKLWWKDPEFTSDSFYYVRATQEADPGVLARYSQEKDHPFPSEMAWSSPVWVTRQKSGQ